MSQKTSDASTASPGQAQTPARTTDMSGQGAGLLPGLRPKIDRLFITSG
ncbi:MAG: hypothetical protein ACX93Q_13510 [Roseovarius sp.]|jgi:hypothetical protein